MLKALWSIILALISGIGGYFALVAVGVVDPDFVNPYQGVMIIQQMAEAEIPFFRPNPPAPDHLRVLVTHLEGDPDGVATYRLYNVIRREPVFDAILLYRPLHVPETGTDKSAREETSRIAAELARKWNADVVVYGERGLNDSGLDISVFAAATSRASPLTPYTFDRDSFRVPDRLIEPLTSAMAAAIFAKSGFLKRGPSSMQAMTSTAGRLQGVLSRRGGVLNQSLQSELWNTLGELYLQIAVKAEDAGWSEKAIAALKTSQDWSRVHAPRKWASSELTIGVTLARLGRQQKNPSLLIEAIDAYRAAIAEYSRQNLSLDQAFAEHDLAIGLIALGEMNKDTSSFQEAIGLLNSALKVPTVDDARALLLLDLGDALTGLNAVKIDVSLLRQAATVYRQAAQMSFGRHSTFPWAQAEESLGETLEALYETDHDFSTLPEAIESYRQALSVGGEDDVKADIQFNMANSLANLGENTSDVRLIQQAITSYGIARDMYIKLGRPHEAQEAQSAIADERACLREIASWLQGMAAKRPVCRLWTSRPKLKEPSDIALHWDSSNATGGSIEPYIGVIDFKDGWIKVYRLQQSTTFTGTFVNLSNGETAQCSAKVTVVATE